MISHYFPERFPSFWEHFDQAVSEGKISSVREVRSELEKGAPYDGNRSMEFLTHENRYRIRPRRLQVQERHSRPPHRGGP
ncbi:MAG: DUF4411 family protein [Planctomycetes bacterium]|nr:DUF4411 family protein [Phycisphaerae bacterium]NBB96191.1 DUF4411 family protein [Planctomycetota bacterium]